MKNLLFIFFIISSAVLTNAQERFLIQESDSINLYETYLSNTSKGNMFPSFYKNGLIYLSNSSPNKFNLYYSDLTLESEKISLKKLSFGAATIYGSQIYYTATTKYYNTAIYSGIIENFKVSKIKPLEFCKPDFNYSDPFISEDGQQLVLISDEKNVLHIKEYIKNAQDKWILKSVPYISHPRFDIINPTLYNKNTIYFAANIYNGAVKKVSYSTDKEGKITVNSVEREEGVFNIYITKRVKGKWSIPKKVHELSSEFDELGVLFDSEKSGYLTTFRYNSNDNIYYFQLKN